MPPLPRLVIDRPSLLDRLDGAVQRPLTWISGPVGSGKTTLVAQWCRQRRIGRVVWMDGSPDGSAATIAADLPDLTAEAPDAVIVIDGVESRELAVVVVDLARGLHAAGHGQTHLVALSRQAPPPALVPLTLRGVADHLDGSDLELQPAEVAAVIGAHAGRRVSDRTAEEVAARLHGWTAGAVIVGMSHPGGDDAAPGDLLAAAAEGIEAYLVAEVLEPVSAEQRAFLLLTACADDLVPALADAMTGRADGDWMLRSLRSAGLPLERNRSAAGWFAHLAPIREALDQQASREMPDERAAALRAAAEWYGTQSMPFEAAWCLVRLGDWDGVIGVIFVHLQQILEADELGRLADLIAAAPPAFMRERVGLGLQGAWVVLMDGRVAAANELLAVFEQYMDPIQRAVATGLRSDMVSWVTDVNGCLAHAEAAIADWDSIGSAAFEAHERTTSSYTADTDDTYRSLLHVNALVACGYGGLWQRADGHLVDLAPETAATMPQLRIVQRLGDRATYFALAGLAARAEAEAAAGLAIAADAGLLNHRNVASTYYARGEALRLMLRHREAAEALAVADQLARLSNRHNTVATIVASQAQLALAAGDHAAALELIDRHRRDTSHRPPHTITGLLAAAEGRALTAAGDARKALRLLDVAPSTPAAAAARVSALIALDRITEAGDAVQRWPAQPTIDAAVRRELAIAAVCEAGRKGATADRAFRSALALAADHQLMQPFVELGPLLSRLVQRAPSKGSDTIEVELARRLHAAIVSGEIATVNPRLTAREAAVLARLAEGRSMSDVAADVHLSINTVKTHVKAIYRKLGVSSRLEAIRVYNGGATPPAR